MDEIFWTLLGYAVIFWSGFKIGQHITAVRLTKLLLNNDPEVERLLKEGREEIKRINSEVKETIEPVRVERHGEQLYLFQKSNDEFLGQGSTLEEALDSIKKRFPNRNFSGLLSKEQAETLGIKLD